MNYYNEINPFAARWLENLIRAGQIPKGEVDGRDIRNVRPSDLRGFTQCHFFAGIGGWSYALRLAGWPDDSPVWTGSCPCQPFSEAGLQKCEEDERHLWPEFYRLIRECRPPIIFGEQVSSPSGVVWADNVASDLEAIDYAFGSIVFPAISVGAPHKRDRTYFVSYSARANARRGIAPLWRNESVGKMENIPWWSAEGALNFDSYERMADGIPSKLAKAIAGGFGNAIVPQVAKEFIQEAVGTLHDVGE